MLNSLSFHVEFAKPGEGQPVFLRGSHDFPAGTMTITGANESGKSMRMELIRFALFGIDALRDGRAGYTKLSVSLDFTLKGVLYRVERTLTSATLTALSTREVVAKSTSVVNAKIQQLFGYGLLVFDTAHCVKQGEVEALGNMRPGERKKMVDQTIGLDVLDSLIKWTSEEAVRHRREADTLAGMLVEPLQPEEPAGYTAAGPLLEKLKTYRVLDRRLTIAVATINQYSELRAPSPPTADKPRSQHIDFLVQNQQDREAARRHNARLEGQLAMLKPMVKSKDELTKMGHDLISWDNRQKHDAWVKENPHPRYLEPTLDVYQDDWKTIGMRTILERQRRELDQQGQHTCPACSHTWDVAQDEIEKLEQELKKWPQVTTPPLTQAEIEKERNVVRRWHQGSGLEAFSQAVEPPFTKAQFTLWTQGMVDEETRNNLPAFIPELPDRSEELATARAVQSAWVIYDTQLEAFQKSKAILDEAVAEVDRLVIEWPERDIAAMEHRLTQIQVYDQLLLEYNRLKERYDDVKAEIDGMAAKAENWTKARDGLKLMKIKVKQHLVPSLNAVASKLLSHMTDGARNKIEVSEDFDIVVDGQPLHTLSGSGKAVANLAVRIGLGQVLTSRVFPVLMGDEIDASMDDKRALDTTNSVWSLRDYLSQIILVTHKDLQADHNIKV